MGEVLQFPWHLSEVSGSLDIPPPPAARAVVIDPISDKRIAELMAEISRPEAPITFLTLTSAEVRALIAEVASRRKVNAHD